MPRQTNPLRLFVALLSFLCLPLWAQQPIGDERGTREKDPVMSADGSELYFTRPDHARNQGKANQSDIWLRNRMADGRWSRPLNPGSPINSFGNDRALALSPDGNRMAVVRTGATNYLDLLERSGRNWRVVESWSLPTEITDYADLTFNPNSHRLIYSAPTDNETLDLYTRTALAGNRWTEPEPLHLLNSDGNERRPMLASDGRTLYFRRDGGQWVRQQDRGQLAEAVAIPVRYLQFALPIAETGEAIVMTDDLGHDEHLFTMRLPATVGLAPAQLSTGVLGHPAAPGEHTVEVPLSSKVALEVRPDALQRYAVFLRSGETAFPQANLPNLRAGSRVGSLASTSAPINIENNQERYIRRSLGNRQRELAELDELRRQSYLGALPNDDPERAALRARLRAANTPAIDTLPPSNTTRARYADELTELERMKAKFRQQQEEKLQGRSSNWRDSQPAVRTQRGQPAASDRDFSARSPYGTYPDTLTYRSSVQSGLYPDRRPAAYENQFWENQLQRELPRRGELSPEELARLDADYERKMREVEALRAQLRQIEGENAYSTPSSAYGQAPMTTDRSYPPSQARANQRQWTARSPYPSAERPSEYYERSTPAPVVAPRSPVSPPTTAGNRPANLGITFIPNTAYPNSAGYDELDALVRNVRRASRVVEIYVHTSPRLDPRAAQLLSEERAATIRDFLLEQRIAPQDFRVTGYGNNYTGELGERVEASF